MVVQITEIPGPLGASASGVDLSKPISDADADALRTAMRDRLVLIIRKQKLDASQYASAIRLFGEPIEQNEKSLLVPGQTAVAELDSRVAFSKMEDGSKAPIGSRDWHTDHTNLAEPPKMTALYAVKLPKSGGDTGFANMQLAFENLDEKTQSELIKLKTVNGLFKKNAYTADDDLDIKKSDLKVHPFIRTHPENGKKAIYVHPAKLSHFDGWTVEDSHEFLDDLLERVLTPDVMYRHKWQDGDLVIWDNRALMHLAYRDYDPDEGRIMQRICLAGERPV